MPRDSEADGALLVLTVKAALAPVLERVAELAQQNKDLRARVDELTALRDRVVTIETKVAIPSAPDAAYYDLRERVSAIETKAVPVFEMPADVLSRINALEARPTEPAVTEPDLSPVFERVSKLEMDMTKEFGAVRERLAVVETRAPMPGPPGQNGIAGKDGKDGTDGLGFDDLAVEQTDERTLTMKAIRGSQVKELGTFTFPVEIYRGVFVEGKSYERGDGVTWGGSEWHCNEQTTAKPGDGSKAWTLKVKRGRDGRDGKDAPEIPVVRVG